MVVIFSSITALVVGTTMAYLADRYSAQRVVMETAGGFLIIGGLAIIGFARGCSMCQ
jgi:hypothetical protein